MKPALCTNKRSKLNSFIKWGIRAVANNLTATNSLLALLNVSPKSIKDQSRTTKITLNSLINDLRTTNCNTQMAKSRNKQSRDSNHYRGSAWR